MSGESFDKILNESVDDAMSQLGETVRRTLSFYFEQCFNLKTEEIPSRPEDFDSAANALLGSGATPLKTAILRNLSAKIDINVTMLIKSSEERFPESVSRAQELYQTKQRS